MAEFDANKDGFLESKELDACPGLRAALPQADSDGDKRLSKREIEARLERFVEANTGLVGVPCRILMDGKPLSDATVTFEPEAFLGSSYRRAVGTSEFDGTVLLRTEGFDIEGIPYGMYRVLVSKQDASGNELIPARFNAQSTLGKEIGPDLRGDIRVEVTSR